MNTTSSEPRFQVAPCHFDDLHLRIGDRLQLETPGQPPQRHYATLLGFAPAQSVLVRTPFVDGFPITYTDGQALTARAFTGMGVFAFETAVQRVCISPFHYLHLEFPTAVRGVQIRSTERVRVNMPTQITLDGAPEPGTIADIGIGGARLEINRSLRAGLRLRVQLAFPLEQMQIKAAFEADAVVHRQLESDQRDRPTPLCAYGLEFEDLTLGQRVMLQNFVYQRLLLDHQVLI
jgi:c-di-GMP-binding flagellar brake protein YcgR